MKVNIWITNILMILFMVLSQPYFAINMPTPIKVGVAIVLFLFLIRDCSFKEVFSFIPIFMIPILDMMMFNKIEGMTGIFIGIYGLLQIVIYTFYSYVYIKKKKTGSIITVLTSYLLLMLIESITTYYGCQIFPGASRLLAGMVTQGDGDFNVILNLNIGGFEFIYTLVLLTVVYIAIFKYTYKSHKFISICSLAMIVVIFITILESEYTIALIQFALSMVLFFFSSKIQISKLLMYMTIIAFIGYLTKPIIVSALIQTSEVIDGAQSSRLYDLAANLNGNNTSQYSDADIRESHYKTSFQTFVQNPMGEWSPNDTKIGGHSYVLDNLAKYGFIGLFLMFIMIYSIYNLYIKPNSNKPYFGYELLLLLEALSMIIVNTQFYYPVLTFVMPMCAYLYDHYNQPNGTPIVYKKKKYK